MLHGSATARTLGQVRAWVFGIWLIIIVFDPIWMLAALPVSSLDRMGALRLVPEAAWPLILSTPFWGVFKAALVALLIASTLGLQPYRPIAVAAAAGLTLLHGIKQGTGFTNHSHYALLYASYGLALFPAADGFALWPSRVRRSTSLYPFAMLSMALIPLVAYTAVASHRIAHVSPELFFSDSMAFYIADTTFQLSVHAMPYGRRFLERPGLLPILNVGFAVTTLFELLSPLCMVAREFRLVWLAVMVAFHFATLVLMNIFFWQNLLLFAVLLVDISRRSAQTAPLSSSAKTSPYIPRFRVP